MRKRFAVLLIITAVIGGFRWSTKSRISKEKIDEVSSLPLPKPQSIQSKYDPVVLINKSEFQNLDDAIPWDELQTRWEERLDQVLVQNGHDPRSNIFIRYLQTKELKDQEIGKLSIELKKTYMFDQKTEELNMIDRSGYKTIRGRMDMISTKYKEQIKKIFGENYIQVKHAYEEFEDEIQAYNNEEGKIGVESFD